MSPIVMSLLLAASLGSFAVIAFRRWRLMLIGPRVRRFDQVGERLRGVVRFALAQERMRRYPLAGAAHMLIFLGFLVLLAQSLILIGRGYDRTFSLWVLGSGTLPGEAYALVKDVFVLLVLAGVAVFIYYRVLKRLGRMTLNFEGLLILLIIAVMMFAEMLYSGSELVRRAREDGRPVGYAPTHPAGSVTAALLANVSDGALGVFAHAGFWVHIGLVLLFLNLLPLSKHFHVITAVPNVFFRELGPPGRLAPVPDIEGRIERGQTLGVARIENLDWKSILDLYTCTECGRCSDFCPATQTGKLLSPKHLAIDLRDHLYARQSELTGPSHGHRPIDLVGEVIKPEVLWACTTCQACEQECPVFITYVDKIVDMRRHLVMEKSEFPGELQTAFRGLETSGNPWNIPATNRTQWAEGLNVPRLSEKPEAEYLFWVGCAPAFDERARKVTRATAELLNLAGVDYAILGEEEQCTGDPARRAGNEFLFQMFAQANAELLNGYKVRKIVTVCPHCFNTLRNEYPDFGGRFEVMHHTDLLLRLVAERRIVPKAAVRARVVYHDSCYLGRYNEIYDPPRRILASIPGVELVEAAAARDRGLCCGAGGAQMFKEEEKGRQRVNFARTDQLLATGSRIVSSACPFCMRMLTDGLNMKDRTDVEQLDVAEVLLRSVQPSAAPAAVVAGAAPRSA